MKPMPPERWRRLEELFDAAVELDPSDRAAFLDDVGRDDVTLRKQLESLVQSVEEGDGFLTAAVASATHVHSPTLVGREIGAYRVMDEVGVGGMGAVYLAERADQEFHKRVAIKVARGGFVDRDLVRRFRSERQILAGLEHPNIARLLDGGTTGDGLPFVVMEFVEGKPIDRFCHDNHLTIRERIEMFRTVCAAVQHAHQSLVVHRDIKPGNILVTTDGTPKLLDFGIAKLLDASATAEDAARTGSVTRLLTPNYASPEQIRGRPIRTASDVYSLGVVLYELLTGRRPYDLASSDFLELQRKIADEAPRPPSHIRRELAGDLDNIVMKALQKEPADRYGSAAEFSEDLRRHLEGRPVSARKDTTRYRASKFVQRHRVGVAAALAFAVLVIGFGVTMAVQAARIAVESERSERVSGFLQEMLASIDPAVARGRDVTLLTDLLNEASKRVDNELGGEPEVAATLHGTIGNTYHSIALYEQAEPHLRRALSTRRELLGGEHALVADSAHDLGALLLETGEYAESEELLREALGTRRALPGENDLDVAESLDRLALVLEMQESYDEAEAAFRETLALRRRALGDAHPDVAESMGNLGVYLLSPQAEDLDEAEGLLRESLSIFRRHADDRPVELANAAHNLAGLHLRREQYDEAEPLYREALAIKRRVLGDHHPDTATTLNRLATLFESTDELGRAEPLYREALSIKRAAYGDAHSDVGTLANNLAGLLRKAGRYEEANVLYREAIDVYRKALGPDHLWLGIVLGSYADNLARSGDYRTAEDVIDEALRVRRKYWDEDHWRIAMAQVVRASCLQGLGRWQESEAILLESLRIMKEQRGPGDIRFVTLRLVELYEAWPKPAKAAEYRALVNESDEPSPP